MRRQLAGGDHRAAVVREPGQPVVLRPVVGHQQRPVAGAPQPYVDARAEPARADRQLLHLALDGVGLEPRGWVVAGGSSTDFSPNAPGARCGLLGSSTVSVVPSGCASSSWYSSRATGASKRAPSRPPPGGSRGRRAGPSGAGRRRSARPGRRRGTSRGRTIHRRPRLDGLQQASSGNRGRRVDRDRPLAGVADPLAHLGIHEVGGHHGRGQRRRRRGRLRSRRSLRSVSAALRAARAKSGRAASTASSHSPTAPASLADGIPPSAGIS